MAGTEKMDLFTTITQVISTNKIVSSKLGQIEKLNLFCFLSKYPRYETSLLRF